tara:strand:+ start:2817 stop:3227 length:411 start_codon:yes stop_codon:yes gene_type:complete
MELSKLILKAFYLIFIYSVVYLLLEAQTPLEGVNLTIMTLFVSIVILYFTFKMVYKFLTTNEVVFLSKKDKKKKAAASSESEEEEEEEEEEEKKEVTVTQESNSDEEEGVFTNIVTSVKNFIQEHTHKFIEDDVFN